MPSDHQHARRHLLNVSTAKRWLPLLLLILVVAVIGPQLKVFRASLQHLHHINHWLVAGAFVAVLATFVLGAVVYKILAFKPLAYGRTLIAQLAANFINRLLPAGVGGIGANYRYLCQQQHTPAEAASVVTVNNSLGLIGHGLLLLVLVTIFHGRLPGMQISSRIKLGFVVLVTVAVFVIILWPSLRHRLKRSLQSFGQQLNRFQHRPLTIISALAFQICLTLANVTAFWLCVLAVHLSLSFVAALLVFTLGFSVGSATPTPGGIGGVEAGLVAGLVAYRITSPSALAAVLVFRLVSYWIPLLLSSTVFIYASRRHYFNK